MSRLWHTHGRRTLESRAVFCWGRIRNDGNDIFEAYLQRGGNVCVHDRPKHWQPFGEITYLVFPTKIYLFGFSPKLFVMFGHQALLACVVDWNWRDKFSGSKKASVNMFTLTHPTFVSCCCMLRHPQYCAAAASQIKFRTILRQKVQLTEWMEK